MNKIQSLIFRSLGFGRSGIQNRNVLKGSSKELLSNQPRLKQEVRELWVGRREGPLGGGRVGVANGTNVLT